MVEYRVRPVVRYIVTSYLAPAEGASGDTAGFSHVICECNVESDAELIRAAMQKHDAGMSEAGRAGTICSTSDYRRALG